MLKRARWGILLTTLFTATAVLGQASLRQASDLPWCVIAVDAQHTIHRTDVKNDFGASLSWVIRKDGATVLQKNAREERQHKYFREDPGVYTVYVQQFIEGAQRVISNVISYKVKKGDKNRGNKRDKNKALGCILFISQNRVVNRSLIDQELTANLVWLVQLDGKPVLKRNAKGETQYRYFGQKPGRYDISVQQIIDGESHRISNVITYVIKNL